MTAVLSQPVQGPFSSDVVPCEFRLCTEGQLGGSFPATYQFTLDMRDPAQPVARSVMTTRHGQLFANDVVDIGAPVAGVSAVRAQVYIDGGTGRYAGATGKILAIATLDPTRTPNIVGTYTGEVRWIAGSAADDPARP